jgi:hypothetical protein
VLFQPGLDYLVYAFEIQYNGAIDSKVSINAYENQKANGLTVTNLVLSATTPSKLHTGDKYTFTKIFTKSTPCEADLNTTAEAFPETKGIPRAINNTHNQFCLAAAARDVNVSVNSLTYLGSGDAKVNVSITGSDVPVLCPDAFATFSVRRVEKFDADALLKNSSNNVCSFVIDTNATRAAKNEWFNDAWSYRTKVDVLNDNGDNLPEEVVFVKLDLSPAKIGFDANIKDCNKELVVTDKGGKTKLKRTVIQTATGADGDCTGADVYFNSGKANWPNNTWETFYVYSSNPNAAETDDLGSSYDPSIVFIDFEPAHASQNIDVADAKLELVKGIC